MENLPEHAPLRKREIIVRGGTLTREPIEIIVTQETSDDGKIIYLPTIEVVGKFDQAIESGRFARDMGIAFIVASYYFDKWSQYVTGKR